MDVHNTCMSILISSHLYYMAVRFASHFLLMDLEYRPFSIPLACQYSFHFSFKICIMEAINSGSFILSSGRKAVYPQLIVLYVYSSPFRIFDWKH